MMKADSKHDYVIYAKNITKRFGNIIALNNVTFKVRKNEIVGVVGDNGAGKSTLMKILFGIHKPDSGELYIKGKLYNNLTPKKAYELGIVLIHQERTLCSHHSVWRNIFMAREITNRWGFLKINEMRKRSENALKELGLTSRISSVDTPVNYLSGGYQQGVQISRALVFDADVVILDEPTNALSLKEVQKVLEYIRQLKERGKSGIMISHNVYHVYPVVDRFVILNKGSIVGEFQKKDLDIEDLSHIMLSIAETGRIPPEYSNLNLAENSEA
ncbi:ATP-binding cassette domain-containing protein [Thermococcus atlanticus]